MTQREAILEILKLNEIDPEKIVNTGSGPQTAFQVLEGYIQLALDFVE